MIYFLIYHGYFRTKTDIPRIFVEHESICLWVNVTFYDAVNMIHDVIRSANLFPYTAKFMFVVARNNKAEQTRR